MPGTDTEWKMGAKTCSGLAASSRHAPTTRSSSRHAASTTSIDGAGAGAAGAAADAALAAAGGIEGAGTGIGMPRRSW